MNTQELRILAVDDNPEDLQLYRRLLPAAGEKSCVFLEASSGEEALWRCRAEQPDCVLLDHMLPDQTGLEVLEQIRQCAELRHLPVVLITGHGDESLAVRAMKAGALDYLVKGAIRHQDLERAVAGAIERARLERQIEQQRLELERHAAAMEAFAHVVSHDLQEPLRKVFSFGDLLARGLGDRLDPKSAQYLRLMQDSAVRLHRLVRDLLVMSRAEGSPLRREPTPLHQCVQSALERLSAAIAESKAEIQVDPLPTLPVDACQITQLYQNLISNALKFRTIAPPRIHITSQQTPEGLVFEVADNGIGIDPQYHEKIFEAFQRLHSREQYEGSGIGLAVCSKIVWRHGGRIWVESRPGEGSRFRFRFGVATCSPGETASSPRGPADGRQAAFQSRQGEWAC